MVNPIRGEAEIEIAGQKFVLAATMDALAELSRTAGCETFEELFRRLVGTELFATRAALRVLVQKGTVGDKELKGAKAGAEAVAAYSLADMVAVQTGFVAILDALTRKPEDGKVADEGNGTAAQA